LFQGYDSDVLHLQVNMLMYLFLFSDICRGWR